MRELALTCARVRLGREESTRAIARVTGELAGLAEIETAGAGAAAVLRNGRRALPAALSGRMRSGLRRALDELAVAFARTATMVTSMVHGPGSGWRSRAVLETGGVFGGRPVRPLGGPTSRLSGISASKNARPLRGASDTMVRAEWKALGEGKHPSRYWPLTHLERWIPALFAARYLGGFYSCLASLNRLAEAVRR